MYACGRGAAFSSASPLPNVSVAPGCRRSAPGRWLKSNMVGVGAVLVLVLLVLTVLLLRRLRLQLLMCTLGVLPLCRGDGDQSAGLRMVSASSSTCAVLLLLRRADCRACDRDALSHARSCCPGVMQPEGSNTTAVLEICTELLAAPALRGGVLLTKYTDVWPEE